MYIFGSDDFYYCIYTIEPDLLDHCVPRTLKNQDTISTDPQLSDYVYLIKLMLSLEGLQCSSKDHLSNSLYYLQGIDCFLAVASQYTINHETSSKILEVRHQLATTLNSKEGFLCQHTRVLDFPVLMDRGYHAPPNCF